MGTKLVIKEDIFPSMVNSGSSPLPPPTRVHVSCEREGDSCRVVVKVGDKVKRGQVVAEGSGKTGLVCRSPISGTVVQVGPLANYVGKPVATVTIENDGGDEAEFLNVNESGSMGPEQMHELIRSAGIVISNRGNGTDQAVLPLPLAGIKTIIINGCLGQPFFPSVLSPVRDYCEEFLAGLRALISIYSPARLIVAVPEDQQAIAGTIKSLGASLAELEIIAAAGGPVLNEDKNLVSILCGINLKPGQLPIDEGFLVITPSTVLAIANAIIKGEPHIYQLVSVVGTAVTNPGNYLVPIGTPIGELLQHAGLQTEKLAKVVVGTPLTGIAVARTDLPVTKGVAGIIAFSQDLLYSPANNSCIRCGRCTEICPEGLLPMKIGTYAAFSKWDRAKGEGLERCTECGLCAYVCPAARPLVQLVQLAKHQIS
ncbi:MAG: RnfABCDGE type electron transport complex subunit C [Bacillota bacterium]